MTAFEVSSDCLLLSRTRICGAARQALMLILRKECGFKVWQVGDWFGVSRQVADYHMERAERKMLSNVSYRTTVSRAIALLNAREDADSQ